MRYFLLTGLFILFYSNVCSQNYDLKRSGSYYLNIPSLTEVESSLMYLYTISEDDGLFIFRHYQDSLVLQTQVEYILNRGNQLFSDIRFAYLLGDNNDINVIDPTSLVGIYSKTTLPNKPIDVARIENDLIILTETGELYTSSLLSPDAFDTSLSHFTFTQNLKGKILKIESYRSSLWILTTSYIYELQADNDTFSIRNKIANNSSINRIWYRDSILYGSNSLGALVVIQNNKMAVLGSIEGNIKEFATGDSTYLIVDQSDKVWLLLDGKSSVIRNVDQAQYRLFKHKGSIWLKEYDNLFTTKLVSSNSDNEKIDNQKNQSATATLKLGTIPKTTLFYPRPLTLHIPIESNHNNGELTFKLLNSNYDVRFIDNNLFWKPTARDIRNHHFIIIATDLTGKKDTTSANIEVQAYNQPPRFTEVRPLSIPVDIPYELPIKAIDPDGNPPDHIRYVGLDLPDGASLDEKSGIFTWTPQPNQVDTYIFRVIATDQYGTAASMEVQITVKNIKSVN